MSSSGFRQLRCVVSYCLLYSMALGRIFAQDAGPEEAKEKSIVDRFVVVLEKNPRRGTALDKVYGFYVERNSLDGLIKSYREKAKVAKAADAGSAWMIVGLLESLRGQDAVAVTAFEQAETLSTDNYLASYYLGQSLILIGQPDKAAEALERAIQRKPAQTDLLEVYQALGRVYQRARKSEKALDVWNRLEKQFPSDVRVQEQIATTLLEENEFAAALPRYESLAKNTKDKYRQSLFQMEVAEIKVRLGKPDEAIKEFEKLLSQLLPENWLYREVRRRIESVYLRTDDQAGLIAYYEGWIGKNEQDLEAISRLSRLLASYGRTDDAQKWLERGLKVAPTKKELRNALISQLTFAHKYPEAIAQYEQLDKYEPNNADTLREWGRLILRDSSRDEVTRKQAAATVWKRLIDAKPKDAFAVSQVAELFRKVEMTDEALELYQRAITLAPDQTQYREYLGEFYHSLKRKDDALATWRKIAEGDQRTAPNVARLAEVLASFGYLAEAVETSEDACKLDPKNFALQIKRADLLAQAEKHDEAIAQLVVVEKLAQNDEEHEAYLGRQLRELQAANKLKERIAELAKDADSQNADHWFWLARAYEVERILNPAAQAITKASTLAPQSIPILTASARIYETQNNLLAAADINRRLAQIDRRYRTEYLKQVATLEQKLGRRDKAIQAGRDLIAAAPGNPELYEFFSQLCFRLGESEEGLTALRRSVRVNPTDTKGLLLLATALSEQFRTSEAIELYWRAFDKAANLEERLGIVPKLAELYLQTNQLDRLVERLERQRREPNQQREMTICLAQAYETAGDDGNARQELEKLLTEDTRDIQLLTQLVKLCEVDGDLDAAIKYQHQLVKVAPGKDATKRLVQLLTKSGDTEEATAVMNQSTVEEKDPEALLKSLDGLINQGSFDQVLAITEKLTREQPKHWELLYREGVALARTKDKSAEAKSRFEAILALKNDDDEESSLVKKTGRNGQGNNLSAAALVRVNKPISMRMRFVAQIRQSVATANAANTQGGTQVNLAGSARLAPGRGSAVNAQRSFFAPTDFGAARIACIAWLRTMAQLKGDGSKFVQEQRVIGEKTEEWRELIDWYYLTAVTGNGNDTYRVLKKLSLRPDADDAIKSLYLQSLAGRNMQVASDEEQALGIVNQPRTERYDLPNSSRLDPVEMKHVLECYKSISEGVASQYDATSFLQTVTSELNRSGRTDDAVRMQNEAIENANDVVRISVLLPEVIMRDDFNTVLKLLDRLTQLKPDPMANSSQVGNVAFGGNQTFMPSPTFVQTTVPLGAFAQSSNLSRQLGQYMDTRAKIDKLCDALTLGDRFFRLAATRFEQQQSTAGYAKRRSQPQQTPPGRQYAIQTWRNGATQNEALDFPAPNEVYDLGTIQMLRQLFTLYQEAKLTNELVDYFQQNVDDKELPKSQKAVWHFGLAYLQWWLDDKDTAISTLAAATDELADPQVMKFELARLYEKMGDNRQALETVESLTPTDQQATQNREIIALRMAVNSGNIDRARVAAERLFGLRLDPNLQIQLAQQMHQLGMHEQAESLLARAGRQAGNKTDVLLMLMQQYQSQGKNDVATQIAYQLLQRSSTAQAAGIGGFATSSTIAGGRVATTFRTTAGGRGSGMRQQALNVLKRSGKLPEMIQKVESQLQHSPGSNRLIETLIEYAAANGDEKKVAEYTAKITETKKDDPQFRYNIGQQLLQQGKPKEAIEHFKIALAKDPRLLQTNALQFFQAFQQADSIGEFTTLVENLDLNIQQNVNVLRNLMQNMSRDEKSKETVIKLFKKAWKEAPNQRQQFIIFLSREYIWELPEAYDYARELILTTNSPQSPNGIWPGFGQSRTVSADGKMTTLMTRFLATTAKNNKLEQLAAEVEDLQKNAPQWESGMALLALINLRRGRIDEAKEALEAVLPALPTRPVAAMVAWEIAQELMEHESCEDLAIRYLESSVKNQVTTMSLVSPLGSLVTLYKKRGRLKDARRMILDSVQARNGGNVQGNEAQTAYQRIQSCVQLSRELKTLGFPIDSIRVCQEQLARVEDFTSAVQMFGGGSGNSQMDQFKKTIEEQLQTTVKELTPETLPELLTGPTNNETGSGSTASVDGQNPAVEIDLLLMVELRELDKTRITSALGKLATGLTANPELLKRTKIVLSDIKAKQPDDLGARILSLQLSLNGNETESLASDLSELVKSIERQPLDPPPSKGNYTPVQRKAALRQTALWLVARECLKRESLRSDGAKLGERALEAARQQTDNGFAMAILREWGQLAIESGDKATAERRWSEMLEAVFPKSPEKGKNKEPRKTTAVGF